MAAPRTRARRRRQRTPNDRDFSGSIQKIIREVVNQRERIRAEVLSDHWARYASASDEIYWFRSRFLPRNKLYLHEADDFLKKNAKDEDLIREIQRLCGKLTAAYGWSTVEALRFLLTDKRPMVEPIQVEQLARTLSVWGNSARVTVSFDLWVSQNTLMRAIARLRRMAGQRDKRPLEEKSLRLAEFVSETMFEKDSLSQRTYMDKWNADYPEWEYADVRHFARDCRRAKRCVLFMNGGPPEIGPGGRYPGAF